MYIKTPELYCTESGAFQLEQQAFEFDDGRTAGDIFGNGFAYRDQRHAPPRSHGAPRLPFRGGPRHEVRHPIRFRCSVVPLFR